ncbi:MAG: glycosyltransferase family 4 protein [Bacteroidales bacterium]|nr:glycosyltransferase family 4 protein [Bacteroidales bacterium]
MKGIVFVNQSASYITKDIINAFTEEFENVVLLAGSISESGQNLAPGIKIHKIIKYNRKNQITRLLTWSVATLQILFIIKLRYRGYYLFITSNPPTSTFVLPFLRNKYFIQILDVYPDGLIAGGFIKQGSFFDKLWSKINSKYFNRAEIIFTITDGMADKVSKYVNRKKIAVIPQWSAFNKSEKIEKQKNLFIKKYSLEDKFIIMYSGNIGLGHKIEGIIDVANLLKNEKDIIFVIIGDGWKKRIIEELVNKYNLDNCLILSYQPVEMFKHSLASADIGVVSIAGGGEKLCVPVKTYNLISFKIPLLCITEQQSELANLINKYKIGETFRYDQINDMAEYILTLKNNKIIYSEYTLRLNECAEYFTNKNVKKYIYFFKN